MKTVDRDDSSRATTAYARVRSSRNARVMTTRVNGCSAAVFDRAWIILTTGARGFMKVPRWLYCNYNFSTKATGLSDQMLGSERKTLLYLTKKHAQKTKCSFEHVPFTLY